ncbi:MAG TPA: LarC family nickel insertion protein, partial [Aggregatilineales bacterium]|nr:LarC family nickel insertion protein [Aggregatilineales bacterium]
MTIIAYLDCFAGISGDMFLGALVDAGWSAERLREVVAALQLSNVTIEVSRASKQGIGGAQVTIKAAGDQSARAYSDLVSMITQAPLPAAVQHQALDILKLLGETEAAIHSVPLEEIHFHELGAVDTLVDIVGVLVGLRDLGIAQVYSSPLPWSKGTVNTAHGLLPVPPPAVAALLQGIPVVGVEVQGEMVTPTGAVLVRSVAQGFGPIPDMRVERVGYGAGERNWPDRPNLLRIVIGQGVQA